MDQPFSIRWNIAQDKAALLILFAGFVVRGIAAAIIPPGFDEAYYGVYTFFPAWGYFDHPPVVAFTAGLGRWVFRSDAVFFLRFGALLLFLGSAALLYEITCDLFKRTAARIALIVFHIIPYFLVGMGAFVIPDNALGFFWLLFLYSLTRYILSGTRSWLLIAGTSLGFAFLSKYHAILLLAGFGYCLLFFPEWRKLWKSPYLYAGGILALLIFLPNILWNANHDWVSYVFQFGKSTGSGSVSWTKFGQGIGVQAGYLLPWHFVVVLSALVIGLKQNNSKTRWLLPFALIPIIVFTIIGATQQILPHWPMPGYMAAIVLTSGWMAQWKTGVMRTYLISTGIFTLILVAFVTIHSISGLLPLEKKPDVTLDGQGWKQAVEQLLSEDIHQEEFTFLFTNKWYTGGELAYAAGPEITTTVLNSSDPHGFAFWIDQSRLLGKDGIFVTTERYPFDPADLFQGHFDSFEQLEHITTRRPFGEGQTFHVWICHNFHTPVDYRYGINR
ncbi:MAG: phospholipid carrier-dependent glycosyltransferase [Candidatus Marinimicrobia bacterium]|nr:phospholipid carrier-dependent glycosyltransferase [Candidatus Neomarinimicrobiota bacterium]